MFCSSRLKYEILVSIKRQGYTCTRHVINVYLNVNHVLSHSNKKVQFIFYAKRKLKVIISHV